MITLGTALVARGTDVGGLGGDDNEKHLISSHLLNVIHDLRGSKP